jgi:hypothetical protein
LGQREAVPHPHRNGALTSPQSTSTYTIETQAETGPPVVWRVLILTLSNGAIQNFIAAKVVAEVLRKTDQELDRGHIPYNAKFKGKKIEVTGSIDVVFRLKGSEERHTTKCFVTKEWDPPFDIVVAKRDIPNLARESKKVKAERRAERRSSMG